MKYLAFLLICSLAVSSAKKFSSKAGEVITSTDLIFIKRIEHIADSAYTPSKLSSDNWEMFKTIEVPAKNGQAIVVTHKTENWVSIGFRGTEPTSWQNIKTDFAASLTKTEYLCDSCEVHKGFLVLDKAMMAKVDSALLEVLEKKKDAKIIITGHSLGGAVATVYVAHMVQRWKKTYLGRIKLVTFGSPRVGNMPFKLHIDLMCGPDNIYRVIYGSDPITFVPLKAMGYHHVGRVKYHFTTPTRGTKETEDVDVDSYNPWTLTYINDHRQYTNIGIGRRRMVSKEEKRIKKQNK